MKETFELLVTTRGSEDLIVQSWVAMCAIRPAGASLLPKSSSKGVAAKQNDWEGGTFVQPSRCFCLQLSASERLRQAKW